ncbi:Hypothetical protein NTJ_15229 [Nesidiocoris tenuis]|uniref:Uncharacterized protein n=1 Tax=Nesidiocoris tenuis TaxID=355587 RepID=A0ABN7BEX1_9HEMI|nr:Hypothetical protein NTJ_15229 [Nesidiocoris tenuis]
MTEASKDSLVKDIPDSQGSKMKFLWWDKWHIMPISPALVPPKKLHHGSLGVLDILLKRILGRFCHCTETPSNAALDDHMSILCSSWLRTLLLRVRTKKLKILLPGLPLSGHLKTHDFYESETRKTECSSAEDTWRSAEDIWRQSGHPKTQGDVSLVEKLLGSQEIGFSARHSVLHS